jgi:hypothetical protein
MYEYRFTSWMSWNARDVHDGCASPGVYVVAITARQLEGRRFSWCREIAYVGMTNSVAGLQGRLRQFDQTMAGTLRHGGADRVRFRHRQYARFAKRAYVAVVPFRCNPASGLAKDLRVMGHVARFEYQCLAAFVDRFGCLPEFNDKTAPKFSSTRRRSSAVRRAT